ncbi:MAG TPA: DUF2783 domain-containing protein [Acidisphaera sp.]|nr:DUF2783 domain-containing protein [Acidisphaera sp.]
MTELNVAPNIRAADDFYQALIDTHRGLTAEQSALVNARLILLLANHVGDPQVLHEAMMAAHHGIVPQGEDRIMEARL